MNSAVVAPAPIVFKQETFRGDYTYRNSPEGIRRFPFPFGLDEYMYSVNMEPHLPGPKGSVTEFDFDIDEHYVAECEDRRITLERDPGRCVSLPHMVDHEWDTLELLMTCHARDYPQHFSLQRDGTRWTWVNRPLNITQTFTFGDASTLPCGPFEYITRQVQGDFVIMDQRDNNLFADAGMITSQADWSLTFDVGMSFMEWHAPVPLAHEIGVFDRALKFLLMLQQGRPVRRLNWTLTVNPRLDTSPETYPEWGTDRTTVTSENAGRKMHLRVELQTLFRLPRSNGMLFGIRCYLASVEELATYPRWAMRLHRVLKTLPPQVIEYKGMPRTRPFLIEWLSKFDDGTPVAPGTHPE
jgi:hypothetical protein